MRVDSLIFTSYSVIDVQCPLYFPFTIAQLLLLRFVLRTKRINPNIRPAIVQPEKLSLTDNLVAIERWREDCGEAARQVAGVLEGVVVGEAEQNCHCIPVRAVRGFALPRRWP
jgi:hypothetical protein